MSNTNTNPPVPGIINPLQTNNAALSLIAFIAGTLAAKFPMFDAATWNYIIYSVGGVIAVIVPTIINRKTVIITKVAGLAEVKEVQLDKDVSTSAALNNATPSNVVVSK